MFFFLCFFFFCLFFFFFFSVCLFIIIVIILQVYELLTFVLNILNGDDILFRVVCLLI